MTSQPPNHGEALLSNVLEHPAWWVGHLHEAACRGSAGDLLPSVFNTTATDLNELWTEVMNMDDPHGYWPQIHIAVPGEHVVSVVLFGAPRYQVEYRYGTPQGVSVTSTPGSLMAIETPAPSEKPFALTGPTGV